MASHLRSINESAWQRGLEGDVASEASGPDLSFIIGSAGVLVMLLWLDTVSLASKSYPGHENVANYGLFYRPTGIVVTVYVLISKKRPNMNDNKENHNRKRLK